ncbi:MAG: transaldolase family protein [Candidatus Limnocylindrales bacterium]
MPAGYFDQLTTDTPTRVWVNNPTVEEIDLAIAQGAVGSTTNPAYGGNLLRRAPDEILPIIADCVRATDDDVRAADLVQQRLVARIAEHFLPIHEASGGRLGFVSIQGAPEADTDPVHILHEAREGHTLSPNVAPKIPGTAPGLEAFETLVAEGCPTIVTEVFSLAQFVDTAERYLRVTERTGVRPPFFMSPITGIFGDHLKAVAKRDGLEVDAADMELAGVALSRECYRIARERDYPVTLLCGGARIPLDLTGLVGGALHATINWSTFAEVIASAEPFALGIDEPLDPAALARLDATFDDFRRAMVLDGLTLEEFEGFGPVQHFRNNFIAGWTKVHEAIAAERARAAAV